MAKIRPLLIALFLTTPALAMAAPPVIPGLRDQLDAAFAGRVLLSELNCTACHAGNAPSKGAPDLAGVRSRIDPDYLEAFLDNPHATQPGTTMPNLLAGLPAGEKKSAARAIADFIRSQGESDFQRTPIDPAAAERGREHFAKVGCAACHSPAGVELPQSAPLTQVAEKYSLASLTAFLEDPLAVRPGGRMPDSRLSHWEALDLASYLLRDHKSKAAASREIERADEGRELFNRLGCVQCHQPRDAKPDFAKPLDAVDPARPCSAADYALSAAQSAQVTAALESLAAPLEPETEIRLTLARLNCIACHERDGFGGPAPERDAFFTTSNLNLGEQARIPPPLAHIGAKLDPKWLRKVIVSGESVRPYMDTRMPRFGAANVESLLDQFTKVDTLPVATFDRVQDEKEAREAGLALAGVKNLACVACHTFNGETATTLASVEMTTMTERLTENWFHLYLLNPQQFHPTTIMPGFWPGGKSVRPEILGGDAGRQIDAIWQYLSRGREARAPEGIKREPIDYGPINGEAVMLRRQYQGIGKRGIGVGYSSGINLSFDAGQMRLGSIWKGDFGEMSGVWRGQGSGNVGEGSREVVRFPVGPALARLDSEKMPWPVLEPSEKAPGLQFRGYTLDEKRRPTFAYTFEETDVTDQWIDLPNGPTLVRTLTFDPPAPANAFFRAAADPETKPGEAANTFRLSRELSLKLPDDVMLRNLEAGKELLIPLSGKSSLVIEYTFRNE